MSTSQANVAFASLVDCAANGSFVKGTRHSKPTAILVSVEAGEEAKRAMKNPRPNFGELLMADRGLPDVEINRIVPDDFRTLPPERIFPRPAPMRKAIPCL